MGFIVVFLACLVSKESVVGVGVCSNGTILHETRDGSLICCWPRICEGGTFPVCEANNLVACRPCPPGYFQPKETSSTENVHGCNWMTQCPYELGFVVLFDGNRTEDRKCECDLERGYYDYDHGLPYPGRPELCVRKKCNANEELTPDGLCKQCRSGFKKRHGYGRCLADLRNAAVPVIPVIWISVVTVGLTSFVV